MLLFSILILYRKLYINIVSIIVLNTEPNNTISRLILLYVLLQSNSNNMIFLWESVRITISVSYQFFQNLSLQIHQLHSTIQWVIKRILKKKTWIITKTKNRVGGFYL